MKNTVRRFLADNRSSIITIDENGVELDKEGSQMVRLAWDNVAFVRAFDESVCFFAKDITGMVISVNKEHSQEILECLRIDHSSVIVIK